MNHLPNIVVKSVPHKKQRYNTCGDYFNKGGEMHVRISRMNADHEFLVLVHELVEWYLTNKKGVTIEQIDAFDMAFERDRKDDSEPGDDPAAPYYDEHQIATKIERELADYLAIDWAKYDANVRAL